MDRNNGLDVQLKEQLCGEEVSRLEPPPYLLGLLCAMNSHSSSRSYSTSNCGVLMQGLYCSTLTPLVESEAQKINCRARRNGIHTPRCQIRPNLLYPQEQCRSSYRAAPIESQTPKRFSLSWQQSSRIQPPRSRQLSSFFALPKGYRSLPTISIVQFLSISLELHSGKNQA